MTVVAAYTDGHVTWIGSDRNGVCSSGLWFDIGPKWYGAHGWAFGQVGDSRVGNIIAQNASALFADLDGPMSFTERLAELYQQHGMKPVFREGETVPSWSNAGILVRAGAIWDTDSFLAFSEMQLKRVWARGSGGIEAMCSAWGYQEANPTAPPDLLIKIAIQGAIRHNAEIRGLWQDRINPLRADTAAA